MSAAVLKAGARGPQTTGTIVSQADKRSAVVTVEGPIAALKSADPEDFVPDGYTLDTSNVTPSGDGLGKLTINCVKYEEGTSFSAIRTTFRIEMQEVQYDLEDHPYLADARSMILKWLATDEAQRFDGNSYKYMDADGELKTVSGEKALKFCAAYMAGIKTFTRYYPVVEKISTWSNPPGLNMSGKSFSGGSPTFSSDAGKFSEPPISLNGYASTNWFKSKDSWAENENKTWTRTEQWTYTPESSSGSHAWIYNEL